MLEASKKIQDVKYTVTHFGRPNAQLLQDYILKIEKQCQKNEAYFLMILLLWFVKIIPTLNAGKITCS